MGRLVRRRPAADALAAVPRRAGRGRLRVARAGTVRLPAHRPGAAEGRAGASWPAGRRPAPCTATAACTGPTSSTAIAGADPQGRRADRGRSARRHLVFVPVPGYRDDTTGAYLEPAELDRGRVADAGPQHRRAGPDRRRGARRAAAVPPARRQPRGDPARRSTGSSARPTRASSRSAWTPVTSRTGGRTASRSSPTTPTASATCTSSRWTRPSSKRAEREDLAFGQAVAMGASCEPPAGLPDIPSVVEALTGARPGDVRRRRAGHVPGRLRRARRRSPPGPVTTCAASAIGDVGRTG